MQSVNRPSSSTDNGSAATGGKAVRRATKRALPYANGAVDTALENCDAVLTCLICHDLYTEPQVTKCGHTFCRECITRQISINPNKSCPKCSVRVYKDDLTPNYAMNDLVQSRKTKQIKLEHAGLSVSFNGADARETFVNSIHSFSLNDIDIMLSLLQRKKETLITESEQQRRCLTMYFLEELQRNKQVEKQAIEQELELITQDIRFASTRTPKIIPLERTIATDSGSSASPSISSALSLITTDGASYSSEIGGADHKLPKQAHDLDHSSLSSMRKRIAEHFQELSQIYLDCRNVELVEPRQNDAQVPNEIDSVSYESLETFGETLTRISRYHRLKPLATLSYSADLLSNSNIVSSIEFDRDSEYFAIAGVTKKIKLFEYVTVVGSSVDIHCPSSELTCTAKISCVAWSGYYKHYLASSDYDGCVTLWDASTSQKNRGFNEHEKRVWSVDWSNGDPRLLASGSDDSKVRLWSTNSDRSVAQLEAKANVCCVKFCPKNTYNIAFGSADHCVHYYDFRHPKEPLGVLQGHKKAVSYVKFASKDELVSASTDSQLKLWNLEDMRVVRSFKGHVNEKNFVGLATDGNYIACGSENNSLYVFYKALPKPLFSFKFDNHRSMLERPRTDESSEFVSAVAWKKGSPVVVAANSQGAIKILELV